MVEEKIIESKIIRSTEITSIILIEDIWEMCKALGWDHGEFWNTQIAPYKEGTLVKYVRQLTPVHKIISVEEVTNEMVENALRKPDDSSREVKK